MPNNSANAEQANYCLPNFLNASREQASQKSKIEIQIQIKIRIYVEISDDKHYCCIAQLGVLRSDLLASVA